VTDDVLGRNVFVADSPHTRHTVLVVDDDIQTLRTMVEILSRDDLDVRTANDAAPAFELLALLAARLPCMILLAAELPGMKGFEMCRRIKQDPRTAHIPLALVTTKMEENDIREGFSAGAVDYIKKPFDREEVRMRVRMQIRLHESRTEAALRDGEEKYRKIFNTSHDAIMTIEPPTWRFVDANPATLTMFRAKDLADFTSRGPMGVSPEKQHDGRPSGDAAQEWIQTALREGSASFEWIHQRLDGQAFPARVLLTRMDLAGKQSIQATVRDLSEQKGIELELGHARKLEAVGKLASGIAHEINTPAQYVGDGVHFLKESFEGYQRLISQYQRAVEALDKAGGHEALVSEIREIEQDIDLPYLSANAPGSFDSCLDGISRISTIVRAMKEFAHPDQKEKVPANLNQALQTTLAIARNEYKYVAEVTTKFGDLPAVLCHVGDLNQVFLNLIVNAAHAIGDVVGQGGSKGTIRISTAQEGNLVRIDISDSGAGIPEAIRQRIFEPFFTTKEVGKGTGQGLTIARAIVVTKHGGSLSFESEVGKGTTFTIRLPIGEDSLEGIG